MKHEQSRISRDLIAHSAVVVGKLPPGFAYLGDQLRRASSSVLLNFAEGSRHSSLKERRRFFTMAAGSAAEVSAIADVAQGFGAIAETEHAALKDGFNVSNEGCFWLHVFSSTQRSRSVQDYHCHLGRRLDGTRFVRVNNCGQIDVRAEGALD